MTASKAQWEKRLLILFTIAALMIVLQAINAAMGGILARDFGLWPRHLSGLPGIIFSPWLHNSWMHLWSNLPVLLLFSLLAMWDSPKRFIHASVWIILGSGLLVWIFGRNSIHAGASGWLFGLWAWLIARAFFQRNIANIVIGLIVLLLYGGLWLGLLPKEGVSIEYHLAGVICGTLTAWIYRKKRA